MLRQEDWLEFESAFPSAATWLRGRKLWRERDTLRKEKDRTSYIEDEGNATVAFMVGDRVRRAWVLRRLAELEELRWLDEHKPMGDPA